MTKLLVAGRIECGQLVELRGMSDVITADVDAAFALAIEEEAQSN